MEKQLGISIYPDLMSFEEIKYMIDLAKTNGYQRVFLSMILNNLNFENAKNPDDPSFVRAISYCKDNNLNVYVDIDLPTVDYFGGLDNTLQYLKNIGVYCVRSDGGLDTKELCSITTHSSDLRLQINCSDFNPVYKEDTSFDKLLDYIKENGDLGKVEACFNFYPRMDTGLSNEDVMIRCTYMKKYGVEVSGFIASTCKPSILHHHSIGNPTIEELRFINSYVSAKVLSLLGVDHIYFGDAFVEENELKEARKAIEDKVIDLNVIFMESVDRKIIDQICNITLQNRVDEPQFVIRCTDTRGIKTEAEQAKERKYADVTIDNNLSAQYEGEIQIMLFDRPKLDCCNVIGHIEKDYQMLLPFAKQSRYQLRLINKTIEKNHD